jgi:hypothetical protein
MAYMSQEKKSKISPLVKSICKKYGIKASLAVRHHSTLVLNVKSGNIDFISNFNETVEKRPRPEHLPFIPAKTSIQVNPYWYHEHFSGKAKKFLSEVLQVMNSGNHDNSDIQSDYFDVGWYVDVNIGQWDKPYIVTE